MKNLPLLLLGAGAVYFMAKKPAKTTTTTTETIPKDAKLVAGSKEIGYAIYDCEKLVIYDAKKAYDHAFDLGSTLEYSSKLDELLFGICFENPENISQFKQIINTKEKAIFVFNLFKNLLSGYGKNHQDYETQDEILEGLNGVKVKLISLGYNSTDFKVEIIK